jgi:outer membrane protein assembly factor BamA
MAEDRVLQSPVRVERLDFAGLGRTSEDFMRLEYDRQGVLKADNMQQLLEACQRAQQAQQALGTFKHTQIRLEPGTREQDVRVRVDTQEKNWYGVHIGVEHDGADAYTVRYTTTSTWRLTYYRESRPR